MERVFKSIIVSVLVIQMLSLSLYPNLYNCCNKTKTRNFLVRAFQTSSTTTSHVSFRRTAQRNHYGQVTTGLSNFKIFSYSSQRPNCRIQTSLFSGDSRTANSSTSTTNIDIAKSNHGISYEALFIDENIGDPSMYQIPPFEPGDDMLIHLRKNQRILAIGDVHGDIVALFKFLQASQLLHKDSTITHPIWDGGDSILVQCGDILDRGAEELFCYRYLASLARQARKDGGRVILLHGNHEALNANGLFQYVDPKGNDEFEIAFGKKMDFFKSEDTPRWRIQYAGNVPTRWAAFEPDGWLAKPLLKNMQVACVVGRTVFVHAGLTKAHLDKYGGIEQMNKQARDWFTQPLPDELKNDDGRVFTSVQQVIDNANLRARLAAKTMPECLGGGVGAASPVWMRDYSSPADSVPRSPKAQMMIDECLNSIGHDVQRMVMGHTPQSQINAALNGKAWRIDVGASIGVMGNTPEVLEIIHQGAQNGQDIINILTVEGQRIPGSERQAIEIPF